MRLTEKREDGNWKLKDVPWKKIKPGEKITKEIWEKIYGALWKLKDYEDTGLSPEKIEDLNDFEKSQAHKLMKKLEEEREKHRWILPEDRLPECEDEQVLVQCTGKAGDVALSDAFVIATYEEGIGWHSMRYPKIVGEVTAWMPLPEPYKETKK